MEQGHWSVARSPVQRLYQAFELKILLVGGVCPGPPNLLLDAVASSSWLFLAAVGPLVHFVSLLIGRIFGSRYGFFSFFPQVIRSSQLVPGFRWLNSWEKFGQNLYVDFNFANDHFLIIKGLCDLRVVAREKTCMCSLMVFRYVPFRNKKGGRCNIWKNILKWIKKWNSRVKNSGPFWPRYG